MDHKDHQDQQVQRSDQSQNRLLYSTIHHHVHVHVHAWAKGLCCSSTDMNEYEGLLNYHAYMYN